jgi:serine/threonine protein kinase
MSASKQQIDAIFFTASKFDDAGQRKFFLDRACDGDDELRAAVERLIAAQGDSDKLFDNQASLFEVSAEDIRAAGQENVFEESCLADEKIGSQIGRYRLLEQIGEGGCGVVYLAEQTQPICRQVALKIIRLGMDTKSVIARFEAERQALAMMDHPNIARVLDAGATETGRPYFVMELVRGIKITDYCDQNNFSIRQRLGLFIQVCHAIQHAHQKGVIHRDIKPSNILVTMQDGVPVPTVIDFGIAKATDGRLMEQTLFTASEQLIGTPAYMSPEQAEMSGPDVDSRSDIYSLGVLLYELLAGRTPFDGQKLIKGGLDNLRRTLREEQPQRPSGILTALPDAELTATAAHRHEDPAKLILLLKDDLDWIVMKALEKDRSRRYETANGLALDIQRYLDDEPVAARPSSRLYQFRKLVRRNRVIFAAIAAVAVALLSGLGLSTWLFLEKRAALTEEIRLREESDWLLRAAKFRQRLTEAYLAYNLDNPDEADRLVAGIPAPEPNLEYAQLYRGLVDFHGTNGDWKAAADRGAVLVQVIQPDAWVATPLDCLRYGTLLLQIGDAKGYDQFRHSVVARFARTTNGLMADCMIKMSLLKPPDANLLAALQPSAVTSSNSLAGISQSNEWQKSLAAWRCFSLALFEYHHGNYAGVEEWHQKALKYDPSDYSQGMSFQILLAMAHYRTGQREQSRSELAQAQQVIEAEISRRPVGVFWFDWLFAKVLADEAAEMIQGKTGSN